MALQLPSDPINPLDDGVLFNRRRIMQLQRSNDNRRHTRSLLLHSSPGAAYSEDHWMTNETEPMHDTPVPMTLFSCMPYRSLANSPLPIPYSECTPRQMSQHPNWTNWHLASWLLALLGNEMGTEMQQLPLTHTWTIQCILGTFHDIWSVVALVGWTVALHTHTRHGQPNTLHNLCRMSC